MRVAPSTIAPPQSAGYSAAGMAGESTLIVTTRTGVRPLGVRGEPLHNCGGAAAPRRSAAAWAIAAADLLADPQLHEDGKAIDWYAGWTGEVQPGRRPRCRRGAARSWPRSTRALADIARLGATLSAAGHGEDSGLIGRSLQLAAKKPAESFVFLVGDRPVVVCWGYEKEAAASLMGPALPLACRERRSVLDAPPPRRRCLPSAGRARTGRAPSRGSARCSLALPLLLLLLGGAWLLRELLPADPDTGAGDARRPAGAARAALRRPIRCPAIKASLSTEASARQGAAARARDDRGRAQEARRRLQAAGAAEAAAPARRLANAVPPPPPKPAPAPPPPRAAAPIRRNACACRRRRPTTISFMAGCWRTDPFKHETMQTAARRVVLLLRRQRQRQPRMAARPHRLPHAGAGACSTAPTCALRDATRPATTARTGMPTSWSAGAAPTMSPTAPAARRARSVRPPGRQPAPS